MKSPPLVRIGNLSLEDLTQKAAQARYQNRMFVQLCAMRPRTLQRQFQGILKTTPRDWLNQMRLAEAQKRIFAGHSVKEVAFDLGYKNTSHFSRAFKRYHGTAAREWKRNYASVLEPTKVGPINGKAAMSTRQSPPSIPTSPPNAQRD